MEYSKIIQAFEKAIKENPSGPGTLIVGGRTIHYESVDDLEKARDKYIQKRELSRRDNNFLTWKEFKEIVESEGVTDDMILDYIDIMSYPSADSISVSIDKNNEFEIHG